MTRPFSPGIRFRAAVREEKPLQVVGANEVMVELGQRHGVFLPMDILLAGVRHGVGDDILVSHAVTSDTLTGGPFLAIDGTSSGTGPTATATSGSCSRGRTRSASPTAAC